jgi:hypothetical protein
MRAPRRRSNPDFYHRTASATVAVLYAVAAYLATGGWKPWMPTVAVALAFPLLLIWFPEPLGKYTGPIRHGYIDQETPPGLIRAAGWFFLVGLPLIVYFVSRDSS